MVSAILTETQPFDSKFKYGVEFKEHKSSENLADHQVAVQIQAAAFNHRDVWILMDQYDGTVLDSVLGSDGVGYITKNGQRGQRVLINPGYGWDSDERGPERDFHILGLLPVIGTFTKEEVIVEKEDIVPCPEFLSMTEAAALPLAGLTAYRSLFTKGLVQKGQHILITGIGGGVALFALQFAVAAGAHVYVTSSSPEKIQKSIELGAIGGVNYKDENCMEELKKLLGNNVLSAVIDGAGGPLYAEYPKLMRPGGIVVGYGQTATVTTGLNIPISYLIKNIDYRGVTMGSRVEFRKMVEFVEKHKIRPIVSHVWKGLNKNTFEQAILTMSRGNQFGKLVIEF
ncbi:hypothetical protein G6F61_006813 [Rhizopus arrhizus]|nr:hypothetical protein G6F61_006813 [Rhizopus arrhizus]